MKLLLTIIAIIFCLQSFSQIPSNIPTNGLVAWFPFNGNANDVSGNGNNGTVVGALLTADRYGNANAAYHFNASQQDYINCINNNLPMNMSPRTISVWMDPTSFIDEFSLTAVAYGQASTGNATMVALGPDLVSYQAWVSDLSVNYTYQFGEWINVIATYDGINASLYVNGSLLTTGTEPSWNTTGSEFYIGARVSQGNSFFNGNIDDVAIWNRVLSNSEIQSVSNNVLDTCFFTVNDTVTTYVTVYDTTNLTVIDTLYFTITDTNHVTVTDTNFVTITDTNYISVTDTLFIDVNTGLAVPNNVNTIRVYPNPAHTHITIDNGNYLTLGGFTIKITNSVGQTVFQSPVNQQQFDVDLSTWSGNGIYYVNIIDGGGNTVDIRKIVLQ